MDLTRAVRGRKLAYVASNGSVLSIRCEDGSEINIRWVDVNGVTIKGQPVIETGGYRIRARDFSDLIVARQVGI